MGVGAETAARGGAVGAGGCVLTWCRVVREFFGMRSRWGIRVRRGGLCTPSTLSSGRGSTASAAACTTLCALVVLSCSSSCSTGVYRLVPPLLTPWWCWLNESVAGDVAMRVTRLSRCWLNCSRSVSKPVVVGCRCILVRCTLLFVHAVETERSTYPIRDE